VVSFQVSTPPFAVPLQSCLCRVSVLEVRCCTCCQQSSMHCSTPSVVVVVRVSAVLLWRTMLTDNIYFTHYCTIVRILLPNSWRAFIGRRLIQSQLLLLQRERSDCIAYNSSNNNSAVAALLTTAAVTVARAALPVVTTL
jgi:hypothetical protein